MLHNIKNRQSLTQTSSAVWRDFKTRAGGRNNTRGTKFILLGFSDSPKLKIGLFSVFLGTYLLTVAWNLGFVILIRMDSFIHTPMYFFLSSLSLSFLDFCYVTSTTPKMLSDFFRKPEFISFMGCTMQYFFFASLGLTESCLLAAMAYDRCVAVCNPLLCTDIMSPTLCVQVVVGAYIVGFFGCVLYFSSISVDQMVSITSVTCLNY